MTFESTVEHESKTFDGVRFTVRVLNNIQRAKRDLPLLQQKAELTRLSAKHDEARKPSMVKCPKCGEDNRKIDAVCANEKCKTELKPEFTTLDEIPGYDQFEELRLDAEIGMLTNIHVKPALIAAGLISITGADGIANAEDLIDHGPDGLIDEVYVACFMASGLTQQQQKNSSSQSDSLDPVAEQDLSTTATTAGQ